MPHRTEVGNPSWAVIGGLAMKTPMHVAQHYTLGHITVLGILFFLLR